MVETRERELVIRAGRPDDLEAIYALECAAFSADRLSRRELRRLLRGRHRPVLAAEHQGRLVGFAAITLRPRSFAARIYSLAVTPEMARQGIGAALMAAAERFTLRHGRTRLRLEAREDNAAALALYAKHGFQRFGGYRGYYADGAPALRLEKRLFIDTPGGRTYGARGPRWRNW